MQAAVAGQYLRAVEMVRLAQQIAYLATGLGHDQLTRGHVPGLEVEFPEAFKASTGGVTEVEGRRAQPPHAVAVEAEVLVEMNIRVLVALAGGKPGGQQRGGNLVLTGDVDGPAVEPGAATAHGGKHFVEHRVVDQTAHHL